MTTKFLTKTVLPKQWKHWCRKANLSPAGLRRGFNSRKIYAWYTLQGRGYHWRVTNSYMLQIGDSYSEHDRWALASVVETPLPANETEFINAVNKLYRLKVELEKVHV